MRNILKLSTILFIVCCIGCKNDKKAEGSLDFQYSSSTLKSEPLCKPCDPNIDSCYYPMPPVYNSLYAVLVSITDESGAAVYDKFEIPLYDLSGQYISKMVTLKEGKYKLTGFLVIDNQRRIVYAAPKAGSPMAGMVSNPLPISFDIIPDNTTHLVPEVIAVDGISPSDIGYATFDFIIVDPNGKICLNIEVMNPYSYGIAGTDSAVANGVAVPGCIRAPSIPYNITIYAGNNIIFKQFVPETVHSISFPFAKEYTFVVEATNMPVFKGMYTIEELKQYSCQTGQSLIIMPGTTDTIIYPDGDFSLGQEFKIMQGTTLSCSDDILKVSFVSYKDSRCPPNANCVWAGEASVTLNLSTGAGVLENVVVKMGVAATAGPYTIKLVELFPYPAEVSIPEKTAVLVIDKLQILPVPEPMPIPMKQ